MWVCVRETRFNSIPTLNESNLKINNLHRNSDLYLLFIRSIPFRSFVRLFVARSRKINCESHCATVKAMNLLAFCCCCGFRWHTQTQTYANTHTHVPSIPKFIVSFCDEIILANFHALVVNHRLRFHFGLSYYLVFLCQFLSLCVFCHIDDTDTKLLLCRLRFVWHIFPQFSSLIRHSSHFHPKI